MLYNMFLCFQCFTKFRHRQVKAQSNASYVFYLEAIFFFVTSDILPAQYKYSTT